MELTWELFERLADVYGQQGNTAALDSLVQQGRGMLGEQPDFQNWLSSHGYSAAGAAAGAGLTGDMIRFSDLNFFGTP